MEDSTNQSSMKEAPVVATTDQSPEESGWTAYLEDFSQQSFCSSFGTSSMVSDAASFPAWKSSSSSSSSSSYIKNNHNNQVLGAPPNMPNKLTFKKTRAKEISQDDSLEDTASSPVNSPKVSDLRPIDTNPSKGNNHLHSSLGRGGGLEQYGGMETEERCDQNKGFNNTKIYDSAELKKKGLCLVPMSMLVNYLG